MVRFRWVTVAFFAGYLGRVLTEKAPQVTIVSTPASADFGFGILTVIFLTVVAASIYYFWKRI
jgi:hypothetical protein